MDEECGLFYSEDDPHTSSHKSHTSEAPRELTAYAAFGSAPLVLTGFVAAGRFWTRPCVSLYFARQRLREPSGTIDDTSPRTSQPFPSASQLPRRSSVSDQKRRTSIVPFQPPATSVRWCKLGLAKAEFNFCDASLVIELSRQFIWDRAGAGSLVHFRAESLALLMGRITLLASFKLRVGIGHLISESPPFRILFQNKKDLKQRL